MKTARKLALTAAFQQLKAGEFKSAWGSFKQALFPASASTSDAEPATRPPVSAEFVTKSYANHQGHRDYKLFIPSQYFAQPEATFPLMLMLHGCTQSADDFATGTQMNALAEELGFFVAYPIQTRAANVTRCWNWFRPKDQQAERGEPAILAGLTQALIANYPVDTQRVFVAGVSAGASMAAILGAAYPHLYRAVGVHSGLAVGSASGVTSALMVMRSGSVSVRHIKAPFVPTIVFQGDADKTVATLNAEQVIAQALQRAPVAKTWQLERSEQPAANGTLAYTRQQWRDEDGVVQVEYWLIHGMGHAWSGGSPDGSYTDPQGPDAARTMLTFFLAR